MSTFIQDDLHQDHVQIQNHVRKQIAILSSHLDLGTSKAKLAQLRRGIGKAPGETPELWGSFLTELPEELMGKGKEPSFAEWAVYVTFTMYALHQQGHAESVNKEGSEYSFGRAVGKLVKSSDDLEKIQRRFRAVALAEDMTELSYHLRCMIRLLGDADIALDYVELSKELFWYQFDSRVDSVRLKWGRDFYRQVNHVNIDENGKED